MLLHAIALNAEGSLMPYWKASLRFAKRSRWTIRAIWMQSWLRDWSKCTHDCASSGAAYGYFFCGTRSEVLLLSSQSNLQPSKSEERLHMNLFNCICLGTNPGRFSYLVGVVALTRGVHCLKGCNERTAVLISCSILSCCK